MAKINALWKIKCKVQCNYAIKKTRGVCKRIFCAVMSLILAPSYMWSGGTNPVVTANASGVSSANSHIRSLLDAVKIGTQISTDNSQGKVYFAGNSYWLGNRDDNSITLYAANSYTSKQFSADGSNDYSKSDIRKYLINTSAPSLYEEFMKNTRQVDWAAIKNTHLINDIGSASYLDDKFYLPKGNIAMTEVYAPESNAIRTRYWTNNAWLRTTWAFISKYANWTYSCLSTVANASPSDTKCVVPACGVDLSSIAFASVNQNGSEILKYNTGTNYGNYKTDNVTLTLNDANGLTVKSNVSVENLEIVNDVLKFNLNATPVEGEKLAVLLNDGITTQLVLNENITQSSSNSLGYSISADKIVDFASSTNINVNVMAYRENTSPIDSLAAAIPNYKIRYAKTLLNSDIVPRNEFTVTYDGNGSISGTVPAAQTFDEGSSTVISRNTGDLAKPYKTFNGWNTNPYGTGIHYDAGSAYSVQADVTLYAQWTDSRAVTNIVVSPNSVIGKTSYTVGETFDPTGLAIDLADSYGEVIDTIPYNSITASSFGFEPGLTAGLTISDKFIKITYGGFSTYTFVTVSQTEQSTDYTIQTRIINQPVDHSNPDGEKFPQRYKILAPTNLSQNYIVFYIMGNEQALLDSALPTYYNAYGARNDVVYIISEHRGYGTSITAGDQSFPYYVTVDQALEDYHAIQLSLKTEFPVKWAVGGYSYGGGLSISYAKKYPGDVNLVHSSSGVVDYEFMIPGYDKQAKTNLGNGLYQRLCGHIQNLSPATPFNDNWYDREIIYALTTGMAQMANYQSLVPIVGILSYLPTKSFVKAIKLVDKLFASDSMTQYATSNCMTSLSHDQAATGDYSWRVWRWQQFLKTGTFWAPYDSANSIYTRTQDDWLNEGSQLFGLNLTINQKENWPVRQYVNDGLDGVPLVYVRGEKDPWKDYQLTKDDESKTDRMFIIDDGFHCPDRSSTYGVPVMNAIIDIMGY